jgi:hypothetical protein
LLHAGAVTALVASTVRFALSPAWPQSITQRRAPAPFICPPESGSRYRDPLDLQPLVDALFTGYREAEARNGKRGLEEVTKRLAL